MEVSDFNIHWHSQEDVEVTTLFHFKDPNSKTLSWWYWCSKESNKR